MERYNQGFKYFGPMEQCKDGEWVRYEDVKKLSANLESIYCAGQDIKEHRHKKELKRERKNTLFFATLAAVELVIPVIVYFIFKH